MEPPQEPTPFLPFYSIVVFTRTCQGNSLGSVSVPFTILFVLLLTLPHLHLCEAAVFSRRISQTPKKMPSLFIMDGAST